jgi:hypothetical protein
VALLHPEKPAAGGRPFSIVGSGFCVHREGVIATCAHVHQAFVHPESYKRVLESSGQTVHDLEGSRPFALFYFPPKDNQIMSALVPVEMAVTKTNFDLALLRLSKHKAFRDGYPTLPIAEYSDLYEGMEIGLCGFPLGSVLQERIGTVTSSYSKGILSSVIPAAGIPRDDVLGFQLDITATNGNSGGPVFALATGQVFGVLQSGVLHTASRQPFGLTKAEPVYPLMTDDTVERLLAARWPGQASGSVAGGGQA